jgi:hypothetical protein
MNLELELTGLSVLDSPNVYLRWSFMLILPIIETVLLRGVSERIGSAGGIVFYSDETAVLKEVKVIKSKEFSSVF